MSNGPKHGACILPSRGIFYRNPTTGEPLLPSGTVYVRKLTIGEEDTLQSPGIDPMTRLASIIRTSCIIAESADPAAKPLFAPEELLMTDRQAILLAQRIKSHGGEYRVDFKCSSCGRVNKQTVNIERELNCYYPEDVIAKAKAIRSEQYPNGRDLINEEPFPVTLPDQGVTVSVRFLRGKDELALYRRVKSYQMKTTDVTDRSNSLRLAMAIVSIDGKQMNDLQKEEWIKTCTSSDSAALRNEIDLRETGIDTRMYPECRNCGTPNTVKVSFDFDFFFPSAD